MNKIHPKVKDVKKIGIFRALQLGDLLCVIPAIRALRAALPDAEITLISLPWATSLVTRFPQYFQNFIHFPGYPGLPEQPFNANASTVFKQQIADAGFDIIFQLQGNGSIVNAMWKEITDVTLAGFHSFGSYMNDEFFIEYPGGHESERHLAVMQHLGIRSCGTYLEFPAFPGDIIELDGLALPVKPQKYVCIHPGSRGSQRQWPPAYFAALADICAAHNLQPVITGTSDEMSIVQQVIDHMNHEAITVAGKTTMGSMAQLVSECCLLISNCTGVAHIASAVRTRTIIISMDGEPERWAPTDRSLHAVFDWTRTQDFSMIAATLREILGKIIAANNGTPV